MSTVKDETGNVYGRLTVLHQEGHDEISRAIRWLCQCECGNYIVTRGTALRAGRTRSCGCLRGGRGTGRLPPGTAALNAIYSRYRWEARSRGFEFKITSEEFRQISQQPCHYCGVAPSNYKDAGPPGKKLNGGSFYNGMDRVDPKRGYMSNNVVSCCRQCNWAKKDLALEDFLQWIERVHDFQKGEADAK